MLSIAAAASYIRREKENSSELLFITLMSDYHDNSHVWIYWPGTAGSITGGRVMTLNIDQIYN